MKYSNTQNSSNLRTMAVFFTLLTILLTPVQAHASSGDDATVQWKADFGVALLNDSNVAIDDLDQDSTEGDSATKLSAKVGANVQLSEKLAIRASASLSDKSYNEFDQFDLQTSLFSLQTSYEFTNFKLGAGIRSISTDLASNSFLSNQHLYAFATHRLNDHWFFRGELNFADKEFDIESSRDTSREQITVDAYYFIDDTKSYWTFSVKLADEQSDTNNDQFSRDNRSFKIRYSKLVPMYGRDVRLESQIRFQSRDYDAIDPRIGEIRFDDRVRAKFSAEIPIKGNWFTLVEYDYSDYSSNLASADYNQNLFSIKVGWSLD